jgi:alcohol dehydrogenase (cytochrome c)
MLASGSRKSSILGLATLLLAGLSAFAQQGANPTHNLTPVTDAMLRNPPTADWLMWRRTFDGHGYSPLDQINKSNVKDLQVGWTWSMVSGPTETTPLVHDGMLFLFNYGNKIQALNAATGDLIWEYKRDLPQQLIATTSNLSSRNMAIYESTLIAATSDAHLIALDVKTGKVVWDHATADWTKGWRYTGGPFVVNGKVIQGMTGCGNAEPGGCFITGHDARTGTELWRVNTIAHPGDPNFDTWNGLPLESRFGASAWLTGSYDPEQNLIFYGTGQPYPWIAEMRGTLPRKPGATATALYSDSTLAINPDTGKLAWYHQHLEDDTWDLDYVYERILVDLPVNGEIRRAVVTSGKLGIVEAIDRTNGQWLWHKETVPQNIVAAIDPKTGEKTINVATIPHIGQTTMHCPSSPGGRGWPATAYNPRTGTLFLPLNEFCSNTTPSPLGPGEAYTGGGRAVFARVKMPNSDGNIGRIDAINLGDRSQVWSYRQRVPNTSAVLPTGGGLVFSGDLDRYFKALDDATGKVLWQTRTNNIVDSFPITYSVDGKQYVAVTTGRGSGLASGLSSLVPDVRSPEGAMLWVFALPGR